MWPSRKAERDAEAPPLPGAIIDDEEFGAPRYIEKRLSSTQQHHDLDIIKKTDPELGGALRKRAALNARMGVVEILKKAAETCKEVEGFEIGAMNREERQRAYLEGVFRVYDIDRSGCLDVDELLMFLHTLGIFSSRETVNDILRAANINNSGAIDCNEFVRFFSEIEVMENLRDEMSQEKRHSVLRGNVVTVFTILNLVGLFFLLYMYMSDRAGKWQILLICDSIITGVALAFLICFPILRMKFFPEGSPKFPNLLGVVRTWKTSLQKQMRKAPETPVTAAPPTLPRVLCATRFSYRISRSSACGRADVTGEELTIEDVDDLPLPHTLTLADDGRQIMTLSDNARRVIKMYNDLDEPQGPYQKTNYQVAIEEQNRTGAAMKSFNPLHVAQIKNVSSGASMQIDDNNSRLSSLEILSESFNDSSYGGFGLKGYAKVGAMFNGHAALCDIKQKASGDEKELMVYTRR
eukprot:GEMP01031691.1.p1 GENE.GEMP01031691.1~~GEMP01031691.1.p1  ORF type:complete len:466 (+),score=75.32 GEMP01031691.1:146-1543(+)